jgi:photosystem II stability/assembly factor-like uncharacterized protein
MHYRLILSKQKYLGGKFMSKKILRSISLFNVIALIVAIASTFIHGTAITVSAASGYTWNNVKIMGGGFIPGIIFNTKKKDLIYARTDIGGAYRWNATTNSWVSISDSVGFVDWNKNGVDALATDPVDPNRVYMATGTYTNAWDTNGQIMRSTDQGNSWQVTSLPFKVGGNMPGRSMGERLVIDPNDNSILYFGARGENGLWKSTDYGVTWAKVTSFTNSGTYIQNPGQEYGSDAIGISWITFDPSTGTSGKATQTIYMGVADKGNSVYRSTDAGATWSAVPGQPTGLLPHHGVLSSTGILYISYSNGVGPYDGSSGDVWKFNTITGTWTRISPVPSTDKDNNYYGYGGLAVDAQHPNTVMVATLNSWWPDAIIYRSTDAGATWTRIWDWNGYPNTTLHYTQDISASPWLTMGIPADPPTPSPKLGWMIGDLEIDPFNSDRMMYGTGATLYGTNNLTAWDSGNKVNISVMAQGIEETAVCSLISPPSGANLLSGLGDIGGFRHDDLTKVPTSIYTQPVFVTTLSMDYAENKPNFIVRVGNVDKSSNSNIHSSAFSNDGGTSWSQGNSEPAGITGGGSVAVAADGSVVVWSPQGTTSVYYSKDNGSSWTASTGIPSGASVSSDRVNKNKFYGFAAGNFYISTNGGATFTKTTATGLPTNMADDKAMMETKFDFKAMPGHEGDIWCAGGNSSEGFYGIWHSTDSGASFTKLSNVQEADVIGFGKAAPGQNYMALYSSAKVNGVRGIFRSDDAGASWVRINDDQHQYARINMCITGDPRIYGRVYVGTNGRGIVYGDISSSVKNSSISLASATFDKNTSKQADILVTMTLNDNIFSGIYNGSTALVSGTDYTISGTTVTILKSYLAKQSVGTSSLTFKFNAGTNPTLNISISDSTVQSGNIKVQMFNGSTAASIQAISPKFKLVNTGSTAINLSNVKIRYYYTIDGDKAQSFWCDFSTVGSSNITGTFSKLTTAKTGADYYLEIGFSSAAGSLAAGQSIDIQTRFTKADWSNYTQTGDYSFDSTDTAYVDCSKTTAYISGNLQWGTEP